MQTLPDLIKQLKSKEEVDAFLIAGSQGIGKQKVHSDIDVAIILKNNNQKIHYLYQQIEDKSADIFFFDQADLNKLLSLEKIPANKMDAVLIDWLEKGTIEFDKSGLLTSLRENINTIQQKIFVPETEMVLFRGKINMAYVVNKRYFDSNEKEYWEALQVKLMQDVYNILLCYFEFRNIPWRGERNAFKYLKKNDSAFFNLYMKCVTENSLPEKFADYTSLIKSVFYGDYQLWSKNDAVPFSKENITNADQQALSNYWSELTR